MIYCPITPPSASVTLNTAPARPFVVPASTLTIFNVPGVDGVGICGVVSGSVSSSVFGSVVGSVVGSGLSPGLSS